jgi:tetratricopeptide (TPR) repeat protein
MYLRGSKWSMTRKRRRANPWFVTFLIITIGAFAYINLVIVPQTPPLFIATATATINPQSFANDAADLAASGKSAKAIDAYQQAIQADPKNINNYLALAKLQINAGKYVEAQKNAENATLLNRSNALAQAILGWSLAMQGDYLQAEAAINNAISLDPNNALAHAYYAQMLAMQVEQGKGQLGTLDKAAEESRKAVALDGTIVETHMARGKVLEMTSNYQEAADEYTAALAINNNIASLHLSLGVIYYVNMDNYVQAVEEFTKAYALNPGDPLPNFYISRVYTKIGDYAKAVQYAEQALKDNPTDPLLQGNLGSMYYKVNDYDNSILHLRLAIRGGTMEDGQVVQGIPLSNDNRVMEFYARYGLALARANQCTEALQVAQAVMQILKDDETAVYNANEMIRICEENITGTATPTLEAQPTQALTVNP